MDFPVDARGANVTQSGSPADVERADHVGIAMSCGTGTPVATGMAVTCFSRGDVPRPVHDCARRLGMHSAKPTQSSAQRNPSIWQRAKHVIGAAVDVADWLVRYAMVIRVPLAFVVLLLMLSVIDRVPAAWRMLRGLYVIGRWETGVATFLTVTTAWVVVSTAETAWFGAIPRQLVPSSAAPAVVKLLRQLHRLTGRPPMYRFTVLRLVVVALVASPVLIVMRRTTESDFGAAEFPHRAFGLSIAAGIAVFATLYVAVVSVYGRLERALERRARESMPSTGQGTPWRRIGEAITRVVGDGYFQPDGSIRKGPMFALVHFVLFAAVYAGLGYVFRPDRLGADGCLTANAYGWACFPPLASLMLVIAVLCSLLTGLTFLFDRWRVPTLTVLIALLALGQLYADVDHTYPLITPPDETVSPVSEPSTSGAERLGATDPSRVVQHVFETSSDRRLIVVAASGGGITTSAWTARVLTGLEATYGKLFTERLAAISGVSGGSVGTMFYLAAPLHSPERPRALTAIVEAAERSGLRNVAWGLAYPDLLRILRSPVPGSERFSDTGVDRAWALEEAWRATLRSSRPPISGHLAETADATLGDWQERIAAGEMPVAIFNAMTVEDGQQLLITPGTIHPVPLPAGSQYPGYATLDDLYSGRDLSVVTAARLSASFPFVSPMARPDAVRPGERSFHVTDGGFFDNDGAVALQAWLEAALPPPAQTNGSRTSVLFIQIRWGQWVPTSAREQAGRGEETTVSTDLSSDRKGLAFSLFGPMDALLAARSSTQNVRNKRAMDLLNERLRRRDVDVTTVEFDLVDPPAEPLPLSWILTPRDRLALACRWLSDPIQDQVAAVGAFLRAEAGSAALARRQAEGAIPRPADASACRALYPPHP